MFLKKIISYLKQKFVLEFIVFGIVGVSGTVINILTTYIFTEYVGLWYVASNCIGQLFGVTNNFFWNKHATFKKKDGSIRKQYIKSLFIYTITVSLSIGGTYVFTDMMGIWYIYSILLTVPIVTIINFLAHKFIVFKK